MDVTAGRGRTGRRCVLATVTALLLAGSPALVAPAVAAPTAPRDAAAEPGTAAVEGLVRPVDGGAATGDVAPGIVRSQRVVVDAEVLPDTNAEADRGLELPLFPDTTVVADLAPPTLSTSGYQVWNGTLDGPGDSSVVLVERRGSVTGYVADEDGGSYRIRPVGDGTSVVEQIDTSVFPEVHAHPVPLSLAASSAEPTTHDHSTHDHSAPAEGAPPTSDGAPVAAAATGGPVIDVLVAYTTAAKDALGGRVPMEADVALAVEQTNAAFATSGVDASLRLVHAVEVPLNGNVDGTTLGRLTDPADGWNDSVAALRDQYGADLVALIVDDTVGSYCGVAYQMSRDTAAFAAYGTSVTDVRCSTGNLTFAHELGHNFGAAHDRGSWAGPPAYPYGYDWVNPAAGWRTVMAYENACGGCTRLLRFSNPDQSIDGAPVGAPIGAANQADNRALLNTTASTVASFRGAPEPAGLTVTAPTAGASVVAPGRTSITWSRTGNVGSTVKLELLRGSTPVAVLAAAAPAGTGALPWALPATLPRGDDYRIRVSSVAVPGLSAATDPFSVVAPSITVTSQSADGDWPIGVAQTVTWTYTGAPTGGVRLEVVRDGRTVALLSSAAPLGTGGTGSFVFTPARLGAYGDHRIRATLVSSPTSTDTSDGAASFAGTGAVRLTSPDTGGTWVAGSSRTVTWSPSGTVGSSVKVELLKGTAVAAVLATAAPAAAGSLTWSVPARLPSGDDYRIAVTAVASPALFDLSDTPLTVEGTSVSLDAPPAEWVAGAPGTLSWDTVGVPGTALKLELVPATGTAVTVASSAPLAARSFTWSPPLTLKTGVPYRLRGTVVGNTLVTDTTTEQVTVAAPSLTITAPPSSPVWTSGVPTDLRWQFSDGAAAPVTLALVRGATATTIASNVPTSAGGAGSFRWTPGLTLAPAADYRLRVTASAAPGVTATSSSVAELRRPTVVLSAPTTTTSGTSTTLSWRFSDAVSAPVRVDLLRDTAVVATPVANGTTTAGAGSASWAVPAALPGGRYVLRLRPVATAGTAAVEHVVPLTVDGPTVSVAAPSGWARGRTVTASWTYSRWTGTTARVELLRGTAVAAVLASAAPQTDGAGSVTWTVPSTTTLGTSYSVRVTLPRSAAGTSSTFAIAS